MVFLVNLTAEIIAETRLPDPSRGSVQLFPLSFLVQVLHIYPLLVSHSGIPHIQGRLERFLTGGYPATLRRDFASGGREELPPRPVAALLILLLLLLLLLLL